MSVLTDSPIAWLACPLPLSSPPPVPTRSHRPAARALWVDASEALLLAGPHPFLVLDVSEGMGDRGRHMLMVTCIQARVWETGL